MPFRPQSGGCDQTHVHRGARAGEGGRRWGLVHGWACKRARPLWKTRAGHRRDPAVPPPRYGPGGGESGSADGSSHARVHSGVAHDGPPLTHGCNSDPGPHSGRLPVSLDRNTAGWRPSAPRSSTRQPSAGAGPACTDRQLPSRVTLLSLLHHPPPKPCLRGPWAQGFRSKSQQTKPTARTFTAAQGRRSCPGVHQRVTDEQNEIHPHNGISLSPKEGCSSDTCRDVDEPGTHHAK